MKVYRENKMNEKRIAIRLVSEVEIDETLLATLNRFHFKSVVLCTKAESLRKLNYVKVVPEVKNDEVFMGKDNFSQASENGNVLSCDYFTAIAEYFHDYVKNTVQVKNARVQNQDRTVPNVDLLADRFEAELVKLFKLNPAARSGKFAVAFTHDVDFVGNFKLGTFKSGLYFFFNALRCLNRPGLSRFYFKYAWRFLSGRVDYYGLHKILEVAGRKNFRPVFFMYADLGDGNKLTGWEGVFRANPNYCLEDPMIAKALESMKKLGAEIGLHGSYHSINGRKLFEAEKKRLEKVTGLPCKSVRQHYLRSFGAASQRIYAQTGIEMDTTCGFIEDNAYFCSTTRPFYSSAGEQGKRPVVVIPMVFMDAVPLYYKPKTPSQVFDDLVDIFKEVKKLNGFVSIDFHQRMLSSFPEYLDIYEKLAVEVEKMGGKIGLTEDLDKLFPPEPQRLS